MMKTTKQGFTLIELLLAIGIFSIIMIGIMSLTIGIQRQRAIVNLSGYFTQSLNGIDRQLQDAVNNADYIVYQTPESKCEGRNDWSPAIVNSLNQSTGYSFSNNPREYVMLCDKDGKLNYIGKAFFKDKNGRDHNVFVLYKNRRVIPLSSIDNVLTSVRDKNSIPEKNKIEEVVSMLAPVNVGIYSLDIYYPYRDSFNTRVTPPQTQPKITFNFVFDVSGISSYYNERYLYEYKKELNLKTLNF